MVGENILGVFLAVPRVVGENILGVFLAVPRVVGTTFATLDNAVRIAEGGSKGGGLGGAGAPPSIPNWVPPGFEYIFKEVFCLSL